MIRALVRPLEDAWQDVLDAVLRARKAPSTREVARLSPRVAALSRAYNAGLAGGAGAPKLPIEARVGFSFARDVPKGAAAVRELVGTGALALAKERPLRVVDLGAGLGAMTWGLARALAEAGHEGRVEALLVDADADALRCAVELHAEATRRLPESRVSLSLSTRTARVAPALPLPEADVVILGQVLSELDLGLAPEARAAAHAALLADLGARVLAPGGSLVVVEPALRERTRHLHAVRDRALTAPGLSVFAPCLHARPCPALAAPSEWCHEDLAVDLPAWLAPLARAAGLRFQGLTFSYLVLRRDGATLARALAPGDGPRSAERSAERDARDVPRDGQRDAERDEATGRLRLRVVSDRMRTKGKTEVFACTEAGERLRLRHLDRDRDEASAAWDDLVRGDVVTLRSTAPRAVATSAVDDRGRVSPQVAIDVWPTHR